tara:strand:- start:467 stop:640 length:174 start_codon:yes stop_codon:yes gene_type:complete
MKINMNNHDLERMNNHNYLSKRKKWGINLTIRQEKYLASAIWIIGILSIVTLIAFIR